jgi:nitrous oxidase accessory protein NosD
VKRCVVILALAAGALLASATSASAATWNVWPGHSIQRAIRHASRGDTIVVHHGTYRESLTIRKSHLTLLGDDVTLRQPAHPRGLCGLVDAPKVDGICVIGGVDFATGAPIGSPVRGTHITGFHVKGFSGDGLLVFHAAGTRIVGDETADNGGDGLFMFHVAGSRIVGNEAANNGGYGIAGFVQRGGAYLRNSSHGNAEPGFYLGDSPHADYVIAHNKAWDNQYGIFIRHSAHGVVHNNRMWGNCVGALLLDDGEADGLHDMVLWHNRSWANDKACPPDDEGGPPLSGIGVLLVGARHTVLHDNRITNNVPSGPSLQSGGLVMISAKPFGGFPLRNDRVENNTFSGNQAFDIFYDGSGFNNTFSGNTCSISQPSSIC